MLNPLPAVVDGLRLIIRTKTFWCTLLVGVAAAWGFALVLEPRSRAEILFDGSISWGELSRDRRFAVTAKGDSIEIQMWETGTGRLVRTLQMPKGKCDSNCVGGFSLDNQTFALYSGDGTVGVWEVASGKLIAAHSRSEWKSDSHGNTLLFDPEGRLLLGVRRPAEWELWDVAAGRVFRTIPHKDNRGWFDFGMTGNGSKGWLATWENGKDMNVWDMTTGKLLVRVPNQPTLKWAVVSGDYKTLVVSDPANPCRIIDMITGDERPLRLPDGGFVVDISPDGKTVTWVQDSSADTPSWIMNWLRELLPGKDHRRDGVSHIMELATGRELGAISGLALFGGNRTVLGLYPKDDNSSVRIYDLPIPSRLPRILGYASLVACAPLLIGLFVMVRSRQNFAGG